MVSRFVVDMIQIAGLACALTGTIVQEGVFRKQRKGGSVRLVLPVVVLAGVVGALAPINGWLFTGIPSFLGVSASTLNGFTYAAIFLTQYAVTSFIYRDTLAHLLTRALSYQPFGVRRAVAVVLFILLPPAAILYFLLPPGVIAYAVYAAASVHHLAVLLAIMVAVGAFWAYYVMLVAVSLLSRWLADVFERAGPLVGTVLIVLGLVAQFVAPILDLLGIRAV